MLDTISVCNLWPKKVGYELKVTGSFGHHGHVHRSIYAWKSVSSLREEFFLQDETTFESNPVTKPVVTQDTTRHLLCAPDQLPIQA